MSIKIWHGIYDILSDKHYNMIGYWDKETREYFPMCNKLRNYLGKKGVKFYKKYGIEYIQFTLGRDPEEGIEVISIYHSHFDDYNNQIGENVVVGRIKRMRGDVKEIIYEKEEYEIKVKLYDKKFDGFDKVETVYKTIIKNRPKLNVYGDPIIKRTIYFKPYDLSRRYKIEKKDGTIVDGKFMYPYIYKMEG